MGVRVWWGRMPGLAHLLTLLGVLTITFLPTTTDTTTISLTDTEKPGEHDAGIAAVTKTDTDKDKEEGGAKFLFPE